MDLDTLDKIAFNYIKTNFFFDLLAWIPYVLFIYYFGYKVVDSKFNLFRLRKLLRSKKAINFSSLRFTKILQALGKFLPFSLVNSDYKKD